MLLSKSMKNGLLRILNDLDSAGRGGRRDEEGQGGRDEEEGRTRKKWRRRGRSNEEEGGTRRKEGREEQGTRRVKNEKVAKK